MDKYKIDYFDYYGLFVITWIIITYIASQINEIMTLMMLVAGFILL